MKKYSSLLCGMALLVGVAACGNDNPNPAVGTLVLNSFNGTYTLQSGTWIGLCEDYPLTGSRLTTIVISALNFTFTEHDYTTQDNCTGPSTPSVMTGVISSGKGDQAMTNGWDAGPPAGLPANPTATRFNWTVSGVGVVKDAGFVDDRTANPILYDGADTPMEDGEGYPTVLGTNTYVRLE